MNLDDDKIRKIYNRRCSEIRTKFANERIKLSQKYLVESPEYLKNIHDFYRKEMKEKLSVLTDVIFEQIKNSIIISEELAKQIRKLVFSEVQSEIRSRYNDINELLTSFGAAQDAYLSVQKQKLKDNYENEKIIALTHIDDLIDKHNISARAIKKKNFGKNVRRVLKIVIIPILSAIIGKLIIPDSLVPMNQLNVNLPEIKSFFMSRNEILYGDSIKVIWHVNNADSVKLDNSYGRVALSGEKLFILKQTTTFTISTYLDNKVISITKKVSVRDSLGNVL